MAYTSVRRSDLREDLKNTFDSVAFWTDTECNLAINEALRQYNLATGFWKKRVNVATVANQVYYSTNAALLHNTRVEWGEYTLTGEDVDSMDTGHPNWEGQTTVSGGNVPDRPMVWIPVGVYTFALWPADATATKTLIIDGVMDTPVPEDDSDFINLGEEDHDAIVAYALHVLLFKAQRDRWRNTTFSAMKTFYSAAARHNPKILNLPSVAQYLK